MSRPTYATEVVIDTSEEINLTGTSSQSSGALTIGRWYTLFVGAEAIRFELSSSAVTATTTSPYLAAGATLTFKADNAAQYLTAIHEDGSTSFRCHIVPSSPAP